jgi:hypothetical protein
MFHKELRTPKCSQLALKSAVKELKTHTHVEVRTTEGQRKPTFAIGTK